MNIYLYSIGLPESPAAMPLSGDEKDFQWFCAVKADSEEEALKLVNDKFAEELKEYEHFAGRTAFCLPTDVMFHVGVNPGQPPKRDNPDSYDKNLVGSIPINEWTEHVKGGVDPGTGMTYSISGVPQYFIFTFVNSRHEAEFMNQSEFRPMFAAFRDHETMSSKHIDSPEFAEAKAYAMDHARILANENVDPWYDQGMADAFNVIARVDGQINEDSAAYLADILECRCKDMTDMFQTLDATRFQGGKAAIILGFLDGTGRMFEQLGVYDKLDRDRVKDLKIKMMQAELSLAKKENELAHLNYKGYHDAEPYVLNVTGMSSIDSMRYFTGYMNRLETDIGLYERGSLSMNGIEKARQYLGHNGGPAGETSYYIMGAEAGTDVIYRTITGKELDDVVNEKLQREDNEEEL